jgi:hypothetical protein
VSYNPEMIVEPKCSGTVPRVHAGQSITIGLMAKVKSLEPITSTAPPSLAQVIECSPKGIMLRMSRYMGAGTVVQIHMEGRFSLWKSFCCVPVANEFHVGFELVELGAF